jgi:hypothetical protein
MNNNIEVGDVVIVLSLMGEVGTVVEILAKGVYEVEFVDDNGEVYHTDSFTAQEVEKV